MKEKINLIFNRRDFCILFLGQLVSKLGSGINTIGLSLYVLKFENPILGMGALTITMTIPWIFLGPFTGVLADRYSKKKIIIWCDILRGFLSIGLFFTENMILFYLIVMSMSVLDVIFSPAISGFLPFVLEKDEIEEANSIYAGAGEIAYLVGPAIGGGLVAVFGAGAVFIINGISYILSGISEIFIQVEGFIKKEKIEQKSVMKEMKEGYIYAKSHKSIKFVILFFAVVSLSFGAFRILSSNYIINDIGISDSGYGLFVAICGVGSTLGAFILPRLIKKVSVIAIMVFGVGGYGVLYLAFSITSWIPLAGVIYFFIGIFGAFMDVSYGIFLQKNIDKEYIGRVFGFDMTLSSFSMLIAMVFTTISASYLDSQILFFLCSAFLIIVSLVGFIIMKKLKLHHIDKVEEISKVSDIGR